jgi:protein XagA
VVFVRVGRVCFFTGIVLAGNCAAIDGVLAGAWLQPPGQGELIASTDFSESSRYFDANGRLIPIPAYQKFSLGTYIEYGLSDEFTLVAQPFFDSDRQDTSPDAMRLTLGGTDLGLRAGVLKTNDTIVSVQATVHVPVPMHTPLVNFDEDSVFSGDFRLLVGHSFAIAGMNSFVNVEGGYRVETDDEPDEWHADATLGIHPRYDLMLLMQSFATIATRATPMSPRYDWLKLQESFVYEFMPRWSFQGSFFETVAGIYAGRELGLLAAVWYRF